MQTPSLRTLPILAALLAGCAGAPDAARPLDPEALMRRQMELATPGDAHARLARLAGTWDLKLNSRSAAEQPWQEAKGTSVYEPVLGGRYVVEHMTTEMFGMPFEGMQILGYDNLRGTYTSSWRDTMSTWNLESVGTAGAAGDEIEFRGSMIDAVTPEGRPFRSVMKHLSPDLVDFTMYDLIDGQEVKVMVISAERRRS